MRSMSTVPWQVGLTVSVMSVGFWVGEVKAADVADRFIVAFKPGGAAAARAAVMHGGGSVTDDLGRANALAVRMPAALATRLARHAAVEYVEPDVLRYTLRVTASPSTQWPAALPGVETPPYGIAMVQADQIAYNPAHPRKVCIVDTGYDLDHEDLPKAGVAGVDLTPSTGDWSTDEDSHGTHVAGTIAAIGQNGIGVVGVVGGGQMPLFIAKVFASSAGTPISRIVRGLQACGDSGANVINMSFGGLIPSRTERRVVDDLAAAGVLLVAGAGNGGDASEFYPAGYAGAMAVAAVDATGVKATFSQFFADVEIAAPGVAVDSTVPAGSQSAASLTVGSSVYAVRAMRGSANVPASGALADFGQGDSAGHGAMRGKVCLIQRGVVTFSEKVTNCERSGGVGAVIYNNVAGELSGTVTGERIGIPAAGATQVDGQAMLAQLGQAATVAVYASPDRYAVYNGTSMATPHVAGVAALVWSHHPQCSAAQIRNSLARSALDLEAPGRDDRTGHGLVQARTAFDRIALLGCGQ